MGHSVSRQDGEGLEVGGSVRACGGGSGILPVPAGRGTESSQQGLEGFVGDGGGGGEPGWVGAVSGGSVAEAGGSRFWSASDILPFRDGKARRVERGTFPLVAGLQKDVVSVCDPSEQEVEGTPEARVMRLKGYGNSIVPAVAAEFVRAFLEAEKELTVNS